MRSRHSSRSGAEAKATRLKETVGAPRRRDRSGRGVPQSLSIVPRVRPTAAEGARGRQWAARSDGVRRVARRVRG